MLKSSRQIANVSVPFPLFVAVVLPNLLVVGARNHYGNCVEGVRVEAVLLHRVEHVEDHPAQGLELKEGEAINSTAAQSYAIVVEDLAVPTESHARLLHGPTLPIVG